MYMRSIVLGLALFIGLVGSYELIFDSLPTRKSEFLYWKYGEKSIEPKYGSIIRLANEQGRGFCSGVVIDRHYALTAAHCVSNRYKKLVYIWNADGEFINIVRPVGYDTRTDIGLLEGDFSLFLSQRLTEGRSGFEESSGYKLYGFPLGSKHWVINSGELIENEYHTVKMKSVTTYGMSGGPVINSNGDVVGIITAGADGYVVVSPIQGFTGLFPGLE